MNHSLRICFVTEEFYPNFVGGQGIYGYHIVSQLSKLGHKITVLAEYGAGRAGFWHGKKNIELILVPFCFKNPLMLSFLEYVTFILRFRNTYFDIVHANQLSSIFFVLFKPKNVGQVVVSVHHTNYDMHEITDFGLKKLLYYPLIWLEKIIYKSADALLFNSGDEQKAVSSYYNLKNKLSTFIYLGADTLRFSPKERQRIRDRIRKDFKIARDATIVLYVGRLVKKKNVNVLITALSGLEKSDKKIFGVIVGKGNQLEHLKKKASDNVIFTGFIMDAKPYFLASDLFVTTSLAEGGFLLTALEAASFGLPLILSPHAAGFPIIKEGKNGFIISPNAKLLAKKIRMVSRNSEKMGKISKKIARNFSWEKCAKKTVEFYRSLITR